MPPSLTPPIDAMPAKRFFVEMLTRDIELKDAILDLLDNCVDGAVRANSRKKTKPADDATYRGYVAEIKLNEKKFELTDNCGGIPVDVAVNYAFRFGRPRADIDKNLQTVGVYGIGMKRALFKIGTDCKVHSKTASDHFTVHIDKKWLDNDHLWRLGMNKTSPSPLKSSGVSIIVTDLHPAISALFDSSSGDFANSLIDAIKDHYAYIIQKGFTVKVNGTIVKPGIIQTLVAQRTRKNASAIAPYIYETTYHGVAVQLVMGMYAPFPTENDLDDISEGKRTKHDAGWTIICNDRVVLSHDRTHRTGWGEAGVPAYHSQFVMLSGIVEFTSADASLLPVTTTKRDINLDSTLYSAVKDVMRDALKHFTSFTNKWKADTDERATIQTSAKAMDIRAVSSTVKATEWQDVRKNLRGRRFVPELPVPSTQKTHARIAFQKPIREIEMVAGFLEMSAERPGDVGLEAFNWVMEQAK